MTYMLHSSNTDHGSDIRAQSQSGMEGEVRIDVELYHEYAFIPYDGVDRKKNVE
jgi:hypothetical protein